MRREKSCGAAIYAVQKGQVLWLVEHMRGGHVSLCKGHMEAGESEHDTARREIFEETALSVRFVDDFRRTIRYSPYPDCTKLVVFFLAQADSMDTTVQQEEVAFVQWLPFEGAVAALTYEDDRRVLTAARDWLERTQNDL